MAVSACPTIETERLVLRPFRDDDLDDHFAMMGSPEVRRWLHLPGAFDRDAAWAQMAHILGQWELRGTGLWALEERATVLAIRAHLAADDAAAARREARRYLLRFPAGASTDWARSVAEPR